MGAPYAPYMEGCGAPYMRPIWAIFGALCALYGTLGSLGSPWPVCERLTKPTSIKMKPFFYGGTPSCNSAYIPGNEFCVFFSFQLLFRASYKTKLSQPNIRIYLFFSIFSKTGLLFKIRWKLTVLQRPLIVKISIKDFLLLGSLWPP